MTVFKSKTCRRKKRKDEMPDFEDAIKLIEYFDWRSDRLNNVIACLKYRADLSPPVPDDVAEISEDDLSVIIAEEISRNTIPVDYTEIGNAPAKAIAKYYPNGLKIIAEVEQVTVPIRAASAPQLTKSPENVSKQELTNADVPDDVAEAIDTLKHVWVFLGKGESPVIGADEALQTLIRAALTDRQRLVEALEVAAMYMPVGAEIYDSSIRSDVDLVQITLANYKEKNHV